MHTLSRGLAELSHRPALAMVAIALLAFVGSLLTATLVGLPLPATHDEFSYLLAADTFAHGRLTNPTHPLWVHFETFHVIQHPTYMSKYPPAQGMVLAVGQVIADRPIVGVWLSVALMAAAIYWMLLAWTAPQWALVGGALAALCWGVASYWGQSYWGGAVAATGGALLFGGVRRLLDQPQARHAIVMGLGLSILAFSRPLEGLLVALPVFALLGGWLLVGQNRPPLRVILARIIAPLLTILLLTAAAAAIYNARITGNPFKLPYQVHEETYSVAPFFVWQAPRPVPTYNHAVLRAYHTERNYVIYEQQRSASGMWPRLAKKLAKFWTFYLGVALTIPLLVLPWTATRRWTAFAALVCLCALSEMVLVAPFFAHYVAPMAGLIMLLVVEGLRWLWPGRWRRWPLGRWLVVAVALLALLTPVAAVVRLRQSFDPTAWYRQRAALQADLQASGDRHLVIVRYGPRHHIDNEWVYNAADIDQAPVVWAREMDDAHNRQLLAYFADRQAWLLLVDRDDVPQLLPYSSP